MMTDLLSSQIGYLIMISLFATGAIGSLVLRKSDVAANLWSGFCAMAGSLWGVGFAVTTLFTGHGLIFAFKPDSSSLFALSFSIDMLSAFFIFVIALIALFCSIYSIGYVKHYFKKYNIGALGLFYNTFILGMLVVVSTDNGLFFLVAWEVMSVASYFLVIYEHEDPSNIRAGFQYLVMTHIATVFIIIAFLLLFKYTV